MACFRRVPDGQVDPAFRAAVLTYALPACMELEIPMPEIVFIEPDPGGEISYRREILAGAMGTRLSFRTDIPRDRLREVVRHECRHAWQHEHPQVNYGDPEEDAENFARRPAGKANFVRSRGNNFDFLEELKI